MIELINNLPEQWCDIKVFKSKLCEKFRESSLWWNSDWGHIIIRFRNILRTSAHTNPKVFFEKYHIDSTKLDTTKISFNNFEFQDSLDDDVLYNLLEHDIKWCGKMNNLSKWWSYSLALYYKELLINAYEACIKG